MRTSRSLTALLAALLLQAPILHGVAHAEAQPHLDISILSMGSWRPGDFLRVRVLAPGADAADLQGRPVALLINGVAVGSQPLAGRAADGTPYAEFAAPWQGHGQTTFAAELVDTPLDAKGPETDATLIAQPD